MFIFSGNSTFKQHCAYPLHASLCFSCWLRVFNCLDTVASWTYIKCLQKVDVDTWKVKIKVFNVCRLFIAHTSIKLVCLYLIILLIYLDVYVQVRIEAASTIASMLEGQALVLTQVAEYKESSRRGSFTTLSSSLGQILMQLHTGRRLGDFSISNIWTLPFTRCSEPSAISKEIYYLQP